MSGNSPQTIESQVVQRYFGFMIGFMANLLRLELAKPRFKAHRLRKQEVMAELGIDWALPQRHSEFSKDDALQDHLALELKFVGTVVCDFFALGHSALQVLVDPTGKSGLMASRTFREIAQAYELDRRLIANRIRKDWHRGLRGSDLISKLLSRAYDLAAFSLCTTPKEPITCFVIMPFARPFREYYGIFYRKCLKCAGYQAIRAWEGVTNEHYLQMIFMLLQKAGAALADISAPEHSDMPNLNVIHEVGINMGAQNVTYLIRQLKKVNWPSNLTGLPYLTYDPSADDWPAGQIERLAQSLREMDALRSHRSDRP